MATVENLTVYYKEFTVVKRFLNISEPVGVGQPNKIGDVMVIQALISVAAHGLHGKFLTWNDEDVPAATGIFNETTRKFIWEFQRYFGNSALKVDGLVHPGSFRGRKVRLDRSMMTIVQLNCYAIGVNKATEKYGYDHTKAILDMYPMLRLLVTDLTNQQVLVS